MDNTENRKGPKPETVFLATGILRQTSMYFIATSYILFLENIGLSFAQIFAVNGLFAFLQSSFQAPTGAFADKYGRAKSVKIGTAILAVGSLAYFFADDVVKALLCEGFVGFGLAFVSGADESWLKAKLDKPGHKADLSPVFGRYEAWCGVLALLFGVAGGYIGKGDRRLAWLPASGLAFVSLFLVMAWMRDPPNGRTKERVWHATAKSFRSILECFRQMLRQPTLLWAGAAGFSTSLLICAFFFWIIFFKNRVGEDWLPLLWIPFFGAKAIGASAVAHSKRLAGLAPRTKMACLAGCFALGAPCLLVMARVPGWFWPAVGFALLELAFGIFNPLFNGFVQDRITDDARRATFKSMNAMCQGLGNTLVTLVMAAWTLGRKPDTWLITHTWWYVGWVMLAVSLLLFLTRPRPAAEPPAQPS